MKLVTSLLIALNCIIAKVCEGCQFSCIFGIFDYAEFAGNDGVLRPAPHATTRAAIAKWFVERPSGQGSFTRGCNPLRIDSARISRSRTMLLPHPTARRGNQTIHAENSLK
jgi:hypothetical protein